jgi:flagellar hook-length control protein FliK
MQQAPSVDIPVASVAPTPNASAALPSQWSTAAGDQFTQALNAALSALGGAAAPAGALPVSTIADPNLLPAPTDSVAAADPSAQALANLLDATAPPSPSPATLESLTPDMLASLSALNLSFLQAADGSALDVVLKDGKDEVKTPEQPTSLADLLAPLLTGATSIVPPTAAGVVGAAPAQPSSSPLIASPTPSTLPANFASLPATTGGQQAAAAVLDPSGIAQKAGDEQQAPASLPSLSKLDSGPLRSLGKLPLSMLPPEARVLPSRLFGDRFSRYFGDNNNAPTVPFNPSVLTPQEQQSTTATVEDRNATVLARVDRFEFVQRITDALERAHAQAPKSLELELNPPSLGKVKVQVVQEDGQFIARFETESHTTCSLLNDQLPVLTKHLEQQGIQIQRFNVEQANGGAQPGDGGASGQQPGAGQQQQQQRRDPGPAWQPPGDEDGRAPPWTITDLLGLASGMNRLI